MPLPDLTNGALEGVRLLDLSRVIAGPYVARVLADLGADVLKIEPPEGDQSRLIAAKHDLGMSAFYTFANAGKRGLCVDLREPEARRLVLDLVKVCDGVIENFRPGVLDRLGLGWEAIQAANPAAVLVSLNGFGAESMWKERRAYAPIVHAVTGILHDQSEYDGQPVSQRNDAHADTLSALHAAVAFLAALRVAERTGRGQRVEVPMFDAVLASYSEANNALLDGADDRVMNPLYDAGPHGLVATAGAARHVWRLVADTHPELVDPTPAAADLPTKARLRREALEAWMASQSSREVLLAALGRAGIACAPVLSLREALHGELAQERGLLVEVDDRRGGVRPLVRSPARLSGSANQVRGPAPRRGEHNREVLAELLGYDDARLDALEASGVLQSAPADER